MGLSNFLGSNEDKISKLKGELKRKREELKLIIDGVSRITELQDEIKALESRIEAGIAFIQPDYPDWDPNNVKPYEARSWKSPFEVGEVGRLALSVLGEHGGWMTVREIARVMLEDIGHDPDDRKTLDKITNTLGNNLRKKVGDLLESEGKQPTRYRAIRQFDD